MKRFVGSVDGRPEDRELLVEFDAHRPPLRTHSGEEPDELSGRGRAGRCGRVAGCKCAQLLDERVSGVTREERTILHVTAAMRDRTDNVGEGEVGACLEEVSEAFGGVRAGLFGACADREKPVAVDRDGLRF